MATTEVESLALELLRVPSVIGDEGALADHVERWFARIGVHDLVRAGDNVACVPRPFREGRKRVLLLGHLDTVPVSDANEPRIEGDKIFGLGASDMKCADAIAMHLARRAVAVPPVHDLAHRHTSGNTEPVSPFGICFALESPTRSTPPDARPVADRD